MKQFILSEELTHLTPELLAQAERELQETIDYQWTTYVPIDGRTGRRWMLCFNEQYIHKFPNKDIIKFWCNAGADDLLSEVQIKLLYSSDFHTGFAFTQSLNYAQCAFMAQDEAFAVTALDSFRGAITNKYGITAYVFEW